MRLDFDHAEELAALWALDLLDPQEAADFYVQVQANSSLLQEGLRYQADWASLAVTLPLMEPPATLRKRVLHGMTAGLALDKRPDGLGFEGERGCGGANVVIPWALAACFAAGAYYLYTEHISTRGRLAETEAEVATLRVRTQEWQESVAQWEKASKVSADEARMARHELAALQTANAMAKVEIASLKSSLEQYQEGVAVVIWDPEKQRGVLKLEKMPPTVQDKDYQLWVIDIKKGVPVDAGVVRVDDQGLARIDFKPHEPVEKAEKFAISVETKGGSTTEQGPKGPVIMLNK